MEKLKTGRRTASTACPQARRAVKLPVDSRQVRKTAKLPVDLGQAVFDSVTDFISIHDKENRIIMVNKAFADKMKRAPDELIGRFCYEVIHGTDKPPKYCPMRITLESRNPCAAEVFEPNLNIWMEISCSPIFDENGEISSIIHIGRDITRQKLITDELRLSEDKTRSIFENMTNGYAFCKMVYDAGNKPVDFIYLEVNDSFERLTGLKREMVVGKKVTEVIPDIQVMNPEIIPIYGKVASTGESSSFEVFFKPLNMWLDIAIHSPAKDHFVAIFDNISEDRQAQAKLSQSEENHRRSMDESPLGIRIVTGDGELLYANRAILDFFGYENIDEMRAIPTINRYTPESYAEFQTRREKRKRGEFVPSEYQISIVRKDGAIRHLLVSRKSTTWNGTVQFQAIYQDITESRLAEANLLQAYSEMNAIFSASGDSIIVINNDYTVRRLNEEAAHLFNISLADVMGKKCYDVLGGAGCRYYQTSNCPFTMIRHREQKIERECNKATGCFSPNEHLLTAYPIRADGANMSGLVIRLKDIAETKRHQQQMQEASLMASLGEMVAGIAHEVNNPLGSILLYSELLLALDTAPEARKDLKVIHSEARRAAGIMTKLLTYARSSQPRRRRLNLLHAINKVLELRSYEQKVHNISIMFDTPDETLIINGDSNQLAQVFMNLILNAEDAVKEKGGGKITITTAADKNWARVSIADSGNGISQENMRRLFHPFFTTKGIGKGTGLGLSVCYGIVTAHGGLIRAENNEMGGATLVVELPLVQGQLSLEGGTENTGDVNQ